MVPEWTADHYASNLKIAEMALDAYPDIDGVFGTDIVAMSVMHLAQNRGIRVPEDLKVVAYDGTGILHMANPSITTIVQPIAQLAQECVRLVAEQIEGKENVEQHIELETTLRRGQSTQGGNHS